MCQGLAFLKISLRRTILKKSLDRGLRRWNLLQRSGMTWWTNHTCMFTKPSRTWQSWCSSKKRYKNQRSTNRFKTSTYPNGLSWQPFSSAWCTAWQSFWWQTMPTRSMLQENTRSSWWKWFAQQLFTWCCSQRSPSRWQSWSTSSTTKVNSRIPIVHFPSRL